MIFVITVRSFVTSLSLLQDLDEEARRILEGLEQEKLERGGEKAGVGKFTKASLDKNKKLSMFHLNQNKEGGGVPGTEVLMVCGTGGGQG